MRPVAIAIAITAALATAAPAAATSAPAPADAWFTSAIIGAAGEVAPYATTAPHVDDCAPVIREVIMQCHVSAAGLPNVMRVARVWGVTVVYAPGVFIVRQRSCAMIGGYRGAPFKQVCHY